VAAYATVVGLAVAWVSAVRRLSPLVTVAVGLGVMVLGSGPSVPAAAVGGALPGPLVPGAFVEGLVESWKDLLTTAPPVSIDAGLGVVPYVGGFLSGMVGGLLAWRGAAPMLPALAPVPFLLGSFLLGTREPRNVAIQGSGYLVVALAW